MLSIRNLFFCKSLLEFFLLLVIIYFHLYFDRFVNPNLLSTMMTYSYTRYENTTIKTMVVFTNTCFYKKFKFSFFSYCVNDLLYSFSAYSLFPFFLFLEDFEICVSVPHLLESPLESTVGNFSFITSWRYLVPKYMS